MSEKKFWRERRKTATLVMSHKFVPGMNPDYCGTCGVHRFDSWHADEDAQRAERDRLYRERCERAKEIFRRVRGWEGAELSGDRATFTLDGYRFEIKEVNSDIA